MEPIGVGPRGASLDAAEQARGFPVSREAPIGLDALIFAFVEFFCEVEAGRRARGQLQRFMAPRLYAQLSPHWVRGEPVGRVLAVRGHLTGCGAYEAAAVVARGSRTGAIGVRMLRWGTRWRIEEIVRPEDGTLPTPGLHFPEDLPDSFGLLAPAMAGPPPVSHGYLED